MQGVLLLTGWLPWKSLLGSLLVIWGPTVINLLSHFEITLCDKVEAIDLAYSLLEHLMSSLEIDNIHILDNFLDCGRPEVGKYSEASEECDNFLELSLLFLTNGPYVIFAMQGSKPRLPAALDSCRTSLILQKCQLTKATSIRKASYFFKSTDRYRFIAFRIAKVKYSLVNHSSTFVDFSVKCL